MVMQIFSFVIDGKIIGLILFAIFAVMIAAILTLVELRLKKKVVVVEKEISYSKKLKQLNETNKNPSQKLLETREISREFFAEKLKIDSKMGYSSLKKEFEKRNLKQFALFCEQMINAYYSDEAVTQNKVTDIVNSLIAGIDAFQKQTTQKELPKENKFNFLSDSKELVLKTSPKKQLESEVIVRTPAITPPKTIALPVSIPKIRPQKIEEAFNKLISKENPKEIKPQEITIEPQIIKPQISIIPKAKSQDNQESVFVHHPNFHRAKTHVSASKDSVKKINTSLKSSKNSALKENLTAESWSNEIEDLKKKIENNYKNILTKI